MRILSKVNLTISLIFSLIFNLSLFATQIPKEQVDSTNGVIDSNGIYKLVSLKIVGNKKTKQHVIERELLFIVNDTISGYRLLNIIELSKNNLINTSLFNEVDITYSVLKNREIEISVLLKERWYLWPVPVIEVESRNFNEWWETKKMDKLSYGLFLRQENATGNKDIIKVLAEYGFNQTLGLSYELPYFDNTKTIGVTSSILINHNKEVAFISDQNKLVYYRDSRNDARNEFTSFVKFQYRPKIYCTHYLTLQYNNVSIIDTIAHYLNPRYLTNGLSTLSYLTIQYFFKKEEK